MARRSGAAGSLAARKVSWSCCNSVVAADHGHLDALDAAGGGPEGAGLGALHQVDAQRLGLALDLERRQRLDIEQAAHVAVGVVGDQDAADGRRVLQPAGDIDGIAHGRELRRGADVADQHRAGVDADAHRQRHVVLPAESGQRGLQRQGGAAGLVRGHPRAPCVRAPEGHHGIADVFVDDAAARGDLAVERLPEGIHQLGDLLVVEGLAERGEAGDVGEEDGDLFALRFGLACLGGERSQLLAQRTQRCVHHSVAKNGALRFQGRYGLLQFSSGGHRLSDPFWPRSPRHP